MSSVGNVLLLTIALLFATSCPPSSGDREAALFLAQGMMVGEVSDRSAILQTRITSVEGLTGGDVPGAPAMVRFSYGTTAAPDANWKNSSWLEAEAENDFIVKTRLNDLSPDQHYYYQVQFGPDTSSTETSATGTFRTNPGPASSAALSFVVVTGMNYYFFHYGSYDSTRQYQGVDKHLGYPALKAIAGLSPDYFIGTGDNVYFDHPAEKGFQRARENGRNPLPGLFDGKEVTDEAGMRRKYRVQFVQPRFVDLFSRTGTYWMKDDHDYRVNDSDPFMDFPISHELGIKNFREQLPVAYPPQSQQPTYRTFAMSADVQIWLVEGRDYRSANDSPDGPEKTLWGAEQKAWLQKTLLESTATFKLLLSPTALVGPDDAYKQDNHTNGFRHEGDAFFDWLTANGFLEKNLFLLCGDRHWQYHAVHPSGFEEFSCGALVDANSRAGRVAGDPESTDPEGKIRQLYIQGTADQASGGFLHVSVNRNEEGYPLIVFTHYDEKGERLYQFEKVARGR